MSAIHEIEAFILFLIAAVTLSGAGIIGAITSQKKEQASTGTSEGEQEKGI